MARRNLSEELDEAIEMLMAHPDRPHPAVSPRLGALLRIAGELRGLPRRAFRDRLKGELLAGAQVNADAAPPPHYGKPLLTVADYIARLEELKSQPALLPFRLATALGDLPDRGSRFLTSLNECTVGVSRMAGASHWECHPGDELLHVLEGDAEVETAIAGRTVHTALPQGSLLICPAGLWHRVCARSDVMSLFFATPGEGTVASEGDAPPAGGGRPGSAALVAHDVSAVVCDVPELAIGPQTTAADADAAVRSLTRLGPCTLGVMRYSGLTPWERHPDGDELLHVLDGAVDLTVLTDAGPRQAQLEAGSIFVCPKGLWHRQLPRPVVTMLYGTPTRGGEVSFADDPRTGSGHW